MSRTVVVLGAGPGGMTAATQLRQLLPEGDRVVLIDRGDAQRLGVAHLLVLRGWQTADAVTIRPSALTQQGIEFVQAEISRVDPEQRRVETSTGTFDYDALVVALGADLRPDLVPGLAEALAEGGAEEFYSLAGAERLRDRLATFTGGRIALVISRMPYKCPPAPYEAALMIADLMRERGIRDQTAIGLFTPEPSPIGPGGPTVGDAIRGILREHDIELTTDAALASVNHPAAQVEFASGERVPYDLLIVVPPHAAPRVLVDSGLVQNGWLAADRHTLRTAFDRVWAIGDASAVPMGNGMPLPKAGIFASGGAEAAARDIARTLGVDAPEPAFAGEGRCWFIVADGQAGSIGGHFLAPDGPQIALATPTPDGFREMQSEVREWVRTWSS